MAHTQCPLTTEQLREQAALHRDNARKHKGPTHNTRNEEAQISFYREIQETMASVYEELADRRDQAE